ncbi:MAG: mechanosensitive ion channel domain-containing protein [bacterium]
MKEVSAQNISSGLKSTLLDLGFSDTLASYLADFAYLFIVLAASVVAYYIAKYIINNFLKRLIRNSKSKWDDYLYEHKVFTRLALLLPAFVLEVALQAAGSQHPEAVRFIEMGLKIYIIFILMIVIVSFFNAVKQIYGELDISGSKPIKGYIQIGKIITFVVGGISVVSILLGQSPLSLLAGLGAMSAILLLIFKDSLLGFVAGVQISSNKLVSLGDWITMPKYHTDGNVIDISLVTVKVRNFDNSVSCIPTYTLISDSFQNWRSMGDAGGRRLKRSFLIDTGTIRFLNPGILEHLKDKGIQVNIEITGEEVKTNLGLFRCYLIGRLRQIPNINKEASLMVRTLQPGEFGLPVEIYAFYNPPNWSEFENFQASLFEEIIAILPDFGLKAFQRPSGSDFQSSNQ